MPAVTAGQGAQADENATTPAAQGAADKPTTTTTTQTAESEPPVDLTAMMNRLGIPQDAQAEIAKQGEEAAPAAESESKSEAETKTEPETKSGEEDDGEGEDDEQGEDEQPELPAAEGDKIDKRQKRINRLTRQKRTLEGQVEENLAEIEKLQKQLESRGTPAEPPLIGGRLGQIQTELDKANAIIAWCDDNAQGATTGEGETQQWIEPKQIAGYRREAEAGLIRYEIERDAETRTLKQRKGEFDSLAETVWPQLFDKGTKEYQLAQAILAEFPTIKSSPEANYAVGLVMEGMKAVQARANASNGQVKRPHRDIDERVFSTPRVPIAPHSPNPPSREVTPSSTKKMNEAMSGLAKDLDGSTGSIAKVFEAMDQESRTRADSRTPVKV